MSKAEDQLDTGGAITDLVFDDTYHEGRSWSLCNSSIAQSEVVFYTIFHSTLSHYCFSSKPGVF